MSEILLWTSVWNTGNFTDVRKLLRLIVTPSGIFAGSSFRQRAAISQLRRHEAWNERRLVERAFHRERERERERELQRRKNRADRFAPRARVFHWGDRAHPSSLASHSKFRSASAFFLLPFFFLTFIWQLSFAMSFPFSVFARHRSNKKGNKIVIEVWSNVNHATIVKFLRRRLKYRHLDLPWPLNIYTCQHI